MFYLRIEGRARRRGATRVLRRTVISFVNAIVGNGKLEGLLEDVRDE